MSAKDLVEKLAARGQTVAFCESLTAGLASAELATVPGASAVLRGGLVTYATDLKVSLAQVPQEVIDEYGVISAECAAAMASGAREVCGADWAVALTGVAGPDPQDGHEPGEVWIGVAGPTGVEAALAFAEAPPQGRDDIRRGSVDIAFRRLIDRLDGA